MYILGAVPSLGKTALAMQMADFIAAQGHDALIFSLEMAESELMARSISRETYRAGRGITAKGITSRHCYQRYDDQTKQAVTAAIARYREIAEHIHIVEGIGDYGVDAIKENVTRHIAIMCRSPVVFIDYVQLLAPPLDQPMYATDKRAMDKAMMELKRLSRDCHIPVIAISSFNRSSYKAQATFESFKESGNLEYSTDIFLDTKFHDVTN